MNNSNSENVHSIKVHEFGTSPETVAVVHVEDDEVIEKLAWSEDGQLLAAATGYGSVFVFLSKLPMLASANTNFICVLTTLSQVTIYLFTTDRVIFFLLSFYS